MVASMMNTVLPVAYGSCRKDQPLNQVIDKETIKDLEGVADLIIETINERSKEEA